MFSDARARIPLKGPILAYTGIALALGAWGHLANRHVEGLRTALPSQDEITQAQLDAGRIPPIDLGSARDLEEQLAPYMPTAGLGQTGLLDLVQEPHEGTPTDEAPERSYLMTPDELRERREKGYVYPRFDTHGRHGVPLESTPRNITVHIVDAHDEPIVATSLRVLQTGDDGEFTPNAYRSAKDPTCWTIGSPLLTPGAMAKFELSATGEDGEYFMIKRLGRVPEYGDVELGTVRLGRLAEAQPGAQQGAQPGAQPEPQPEVQLEPQFEAALEAPLEPGSD